LKSIFGDFTYPDYGKVKLNNLALRDYTSEVLSYGISYGITQCYRSAIQHKWTQRAL